MFDNINMIGSAVIIIFKKYRVFFKQGTETNFPPETRSVIIAICDIDRFESGKYAANVFKVYKKKIKYLYIQGVPF